MKIHEIQNPRSLPGNRPDGHCLLCQFLCFFEMGRTEYLRSLGLPYSEMEKEHIYFPVTEAHCRFRSPAHYDDVLIIQTCVSELKHATIEFSYKVIRESDKSLIAEGSTKLACLNANRKPSPMPEKLRKLLQEKDVIL